MKIIGLTGRRGVGKSTIADMLVARGFRRAHPFEGGKAAAFAYFRHIGYGENEARRMVWDDLRDADVGLPGGLHPRYFLERFGRFMGVDMGAEWTLGAELDRMEGDVVVESVVYEAPLLRQRGGMIYRVVRDVEGPAGLHTDAAQAGIEVDGTIENNGSLADLARRIEAL